MTSLHTQGIYALPVHHKLLYKLPSYTSMCMTVYMTLHKHNSTIHGDYDDKPQYPAQGEQPPQYADTMYGEDVHAETNLHSC